MKSPFTLINGTLIAGLLAFLAPVASGGTVNIDFKTADVGVVTETTPGLLGTGGVWNGVTADVVGGPGGGGPGAGLFDHLGIQTHVAVAALPPAGYFLDPAVGGPPPVYTGSNRLQQEGLVNTTSPIFPGGAAGGLTITIGFLRPGQPYRIVYYNGATGTFTQTVTANGVTAACAGRTDPPPALPGIAGIDHVVLDNVFPDGAGDITITIVNSTVIDIAPIGPGVEDIAIGDFGSCAGLQIQGWFDGEPLNSARRADSAVAKRVASTYKGNDVYAARRTGAQTLKRRGNRARFFFRVENDGNAFGDYTVRGTRPNKTARRRYIALDTSTNVTAAVRGGTHTARLESGESQIIRAIVRARRERRNIDTHFQSTPAGLDANDRATGRLRR